MTQTLAPAAGLLLIGEVAAALSLTELEVLRLIFRGRLAATTVKVSQDGSWNMGHIRVLASELQRYLAAGAKDSAPPAFSKNWFSDVEYSVATVTAEAMRKAAQAQFKSDDVVRAEYESALAKTQRSYRDISTAQRPTVQLRTSPEIMKAANQPIASFTNKWLSEKYKTSIEALLVSRMRGFARIAMGSGPTLGRLYSKEYREITTAALELMQAAPVISVTHATKLIAGPEAGQDVTTSYSLPFSVFDLSSVIDNAF